jgi:hypothetical protein
VGLFVATGLFLALVLWLGQGWIRDQLSENSIAGCERSILDRRVSVRESLAGEKANMLIANDPFQSQKTRDARREQAEANKAAAVSRELRIPREFRMTEEGLKAPEFTCAKAFD